MTNEINSTALVRGRNSQFMTFDLMKHDKLFKLYFSGVSTQNREHLSILR